MLMMSACGERCRPRYLYRAMTRRKPQVGHGVPCAFLSSPLQIDDDAHPPSQLRLNAKLRVVGTRFPLGCLALDSNNIIADVAY